MKCFWGLACTFSAVASLSFVQTEPLAPGMVELSQNDLITIQDQGEVQPRWFYPLNKVIAAKLNVFTSTTTTTCSPEEMH